jgi:hypothetical protein
LPKVEVLNFSVSLACYYYKTGCLNDTLGQMPCLWCSKYQVWMEGKRLLTDVKNFELLTWMSVKCVIF